MEKNYYILKSGRLRRKQNTVYFEDKDGQKPIPVNAINAIFAFGELDINSKLLLFLSKNKIAVHFFNYYGFYSGSFYPREYLLSGFLLVKQAESYLNPERRINIAKEFIRTASFNKLPDFFRQSAPLYGGIE